MEDTDSGLPAQEVQPIAIDRIRRTLRAPWWHWRVGELIAQEMMKAILDASGPFPDDPEYPTQESTDGR